MNENYGASDFIKESARTLSSNFHIKTVEDQNLLHAAIGIVTEVHELHDAFDSDYNINNRINFAEEVGDIYWYVSMIMRHFNIDTMALGKPFPAIAHEIQAQNKVGYRALMALSVELLDYIGKKKTFYGKELSPAFILDVTRGIVAQLDILATQNRFASVDCMKIVITKLKIRYPEKFTGDLAENRDLKSEYESLKTGLESIES